MHFFLLIPSARAARHALAAVATLSLASACGGIAESGAPDDYSTDTSGAYLRDGKDYPTQGNDASEPDVPVPDAIDVPGGEPGTGSGSSNCSCPVSNYAISLVDYSSNEQTVFDLGSGVTFKNASSCGPTTQPAGVERGCDTVVLSACSMDGACIELRVGGQRTKMNLYDADGSVTVYSGFATQGESSSENRRLSGWYTLFDESDSAALYDVKFTVCQLPTEADQSCN